MKVSTTILSRSWRRRIVLAGILGCIALVLVLGTAGVEEIPVRPVQPEVPRTPSDGPGDEELPTEPSSLPATVEAPIEGGPKPTVFPEFGLDKSVTELVLESPARDGTLFNVRTSRWCEENAGGCDEQGKPHTGESKEDDGWEGSVGARAAIEGKPFVTKNDWSGKCWYETHMFCVLNGSLTFYHDHKANPSAGSHSLRMCNEFSQHSQLIRLKYQSLPMPAVLPAPLYTKTPGWVLQFWCQDLYHMTLSMLPAFHTKQYFRSASEATAPPLLAGNKSSMGEGEPDGIVGIGGEMMPAVRGRHVAPDIHIRIAKGKRKKSAYCRIKLGDPREWEDVRNKKWSDAQFPIAGNPYWPFYQLLTERPDRVYPMYKGATQKSTCYMNGIIDKKYVKESTGLQARQYSSELLTVLNVTRGARRKCGTYRMTLIDRRGRTRRLTNIPEIAALGRAKGFTVTPVALELLPIRKQLELITSTDILMGMHGNGITWLQFLPPGSVVVELVGVWYTPYALLWGHTHLHSSMKNNMPFKLGGEYKPFAHNMTEMGELMDKAKEHLDSTSCSTGAPYTAPNEKLENLYKSCVPHC